MGKNHRHKKNLKSEKGKTQFKVVKNTKTKFLPKGLNVTNTTFKVKPIVLQKQLEEKSGTGPVSKRNLEVKDLVVRLRHYNDNVKSEACEDLSYLLKTFKDVLVADDLCQIIQQVSSLFQCVERKVRKAASKVVNDILENVDKNQIAAYFKYFSVNLRCAMTNIDKHIQEDSILFLDGFLKYTPEFVAVSSDRLLPDFLTLISKFRSDSSLGRTLTVNLGSKHTSVGWRIKILSRLHAILSAIITHNKMKNIRSENVVDINYNENEVPIKTIYKKWDVLYKSQEMWNASQNNNNINYEDILNRHLVTLVPLLYETWLEVAPIKKHKKEHAILNEEAAVLLNSILNVLHLLWEYGKINNETNSMNIFTNLEGEKFIKHLVQNFPYHLINRPKQNNVLQDHGNFLSGNVDLKCTKANLLICYLYLVLYADSNSKISQDDVKCVEGYVLKYLSTESKSYGDSFTYLILILKHVLLENTGFWKRKSLNVIIILESAITFCDNRFLKKDEKVQILRVLTNLTFKQFLDNKKYDDWLKSLPYMLCGEEISGDFIDAFLRLVKKSSASFNYSFLDLLPKILDNLSKLKILNTQDLPKTQRDLINILFYLPKFQKKHLAAIDNFVKDNPNSVYVQNLNNVLDLRSEYNRDYA